MAMSEGSMTATVDADAEYFTRRATGLVSAVSQRAALVFNFIPSAGIVPWRRPHFYRAGATQRTLVGIPVVSIAGGCAILAGLFIWVLYLHYPAFGLANKTNMLEWVLGTVVAAVVFYYVARVRRARGVTLELAYAEIPPE
jgi:hypothetical protein